ncbi:NAD(P)-binding domain-containing protein [Paenibacillus piri]|nr:NAD(P)-binding domain-containing protein [Paenibacillus piri]
MEQAASARGRFSLDAPVSGGDVGEIMVGGDQAARPRLQNSGVF